MKRALLAVLAVLPAAAWAAVTPESLRSAGEKSFFGGLIPIGNPMPTLPPGAPVSSEPVDPRDPPLDPDAPVQPILVQPGLEAFPHPAGAPLTTVPLAGRLDFHRDILNLRLGASDWQVSLAADPKFDAQYFAFRQGDKVVLQKIKDVNELRGAGIVARLDANTAYRFKVNINIFSPVRGSTLKITPEPGTSGPSHQMKTGALLDGIKAKSFVFNADGNEYWMLYGTDVDPATERLAESRSLLFIHEDGLSSKAWPVAESALPVGAAVAVTLDKTKLVLTRGADGVLRIAQPDAAFVAAR